MPIDYAPPPVPIQGDISTLRADANQGAVFVEVGRYTLYVHAPGVLTEKEIRAAIGASLDPSNAVRQLTAAAQRNGALVPKTLYARNGNEVYVSLYAGTINSVSAPAELLPYFEPLTEQETLSIEDFERKRLFASVHASRMGESYTPVFVSGEGEGYALALKPGTESTDPGSVHINLSNTGNRFTGREFLDFDVRRGLASGDEFSALARTAATVLQLDDQEPGSDYHETQLGWSRVTPLGLFGASGRYLDYRQQAQGLAYNGELWVVDASYTGVLHSSFTSRITVQAKADYIAKRLELDSNSQLLQEQIYPSLELGTAWTTSLRFLGRPWLSVATVSARKGLGNNDAARSFADLDYWLLRPSYSLRSQGATWTTELQLAVQYANDTVPEQQQSIVGGIGNLHAYVPGVALGDRGLLARGIAEHAPFTFYTVSFKPRVFLEFGAAEYAQRSAGRPEGVQALADIGTEVVIGFRPWLEAAFSAALPLQDSGVATQVRDDARADLLFRLTTKF